MNRDLYFRLFRIYSDIWARLHCRVVMSGEQHLAGNQDRRRIYIVSHPTTYDLPMLVHISANSFHVVVYKDPFDHPIAGWLFRKIGFPMLDPEKPEQMIEQSASLIRDRHPLIYSLKGYGVDFGEEVKPRTGGIRIAHRAEADIYPVHLMIEPNKLLFRYFKQKKGKVYPYTIFKDTLYFVTFCKPLRYEEYAWEGMDYEAYRMIAYQIEAQFEENRKRLEEDKSANPPADGKKRGGADRRVLF